MSSSDLWLFWLEYLAPDCFDCVIGPNCEEECTREFHEPKAILSLMFAYSWIVKVTIESEYQIGAIKDFLDIFPLRTEIKIQDVREIEEDEEAEE